MYAGIVVILHRNLSKDVVEFVCGSFMRGIVSSLLPFGEVHLVLFFALCATDQCVVMFFSL
jgi:hypothetical protein